MSDGHDIVVLVGELKPVELTLTGHLNREATLLFHTQHDGMVIVWPALVVLPAGPVTDAQIKLEGRSPGHLQITASVQPDDGELR